MFSNGDSLYSRDLSESRSLFGGPDCNELRVTKPPSRYGALSPSDTKWITSPERCLQHKLLHTDTLQGISIKYAVPIELIKTTNKLWNHDQLFLRDVLLIPVPNTPLKRQNGVMTSSQVVTSQSQSVTSSEGMSSSDHVTNEEGENSRHAKMISAGNESKFPTNCSQSPDNDKMLDNLFSRFDSVLQSTREATTKIRSNSNLDFSPQLANVTNLTRSVSTVSIVEPGPHGSRTAARTRYKRGRHDFYTDDELPPSSSDEIYLL